MSQLQFCTNHLLGRISMFTTTRDQLHALIDTMSFQIRTVYEEDQDTEVLYGFLRLGRAICRQLDEYIADLKEMADDGLRKEDQAKKGLN
jgi:hypothetical protein